MALMAHHTLFSWTPHTSINPWNSVRPHPLHPPTYAVPGPSLHLQHIQSQSNARVPYSKSCSHLNHDSKFLTTDLSSDSNISSDIDPYLINVHGSHAHEGLQSLRIGAVNIKGVKFNTPFLHDFLNTAA